MLCFSNTPTFAASSLGTLQPVIIVPANWKNSVSDSGDQYRPQVQKALEEIKAYFADQTGGVTFGEIKPLEVIKSNDYESRLKHTSTTADIFSQMDGYSLLPFKPGTVYVVWIMGSGKNIATGLHYGKTGYLFLSHEGLSALANDGKERDIELGTIGHELLHSLGLSKGDYVEAGHPCSAANFKANCKNKNGVYPPEEEYTNALLGTGLYKFPKSLINNSEFNPEICQLYEFAGQECQKPLTKTAVPIDGTPLPTNKNELGYIRDVKPQLVHENDTVTITGKGFGDKKGLLNFRLAELDNSTDYEQGGTRQFLPEIISWKDNEITVRITKLPPNKTSWYIFVTNNDENSNYYQKVFASLNQEYLLNLEGKYDLPPVKVNVSFKCEDGSTIPYRYFTVHKATPRGTSIIEQTFSLTDESNPFSFPLYYDDIEVNDRYYLVPSALGDGSILPVEGSQLLLDKFPDKELTKDITVTYPTCPEYSLKKTDKAVESIVVNNGETEEEWHYLDPENKTLSLTLPSKDAANSQSFPVTITITYTDGRQKTVPLTLQYVPNASLQPRAPQQPIEGGNPGKKKTCHYEEQFENSTCGQGTRQCTGIPDEKGCVWDASGEVEPNCKIISCPDDKDFVPEPTTELESPKQPEPEKEENQSGACDYKEAFEEEFQKCNKGVRSCKGIWKGKTCVYDESGEILPQCKLFSCEEKNDTNKNECKSTYYYDDNVNSCIHKRPLEDNPSECSFDHVDDVYCGR